MLPQLHINQCWTATAVGCWCEFNLQPV